VKFLHLRIDNGRAIFELRVSPKHPTIENFMTSLLDAALVLVLGVAASGIGGAISGVVIGGRAIGNSVSTVVGAFYGMLAGGLGTLIGLVLFAVLF
jgi:hypothetical protein